MLKPKAIVAVKRAVEVLDLAERLLNDACCEQAPDLAPRLQDLESPDYVTLDRVQLNLVTVLKQLKSLL
jgi:hypothetical protein